MGQPHRFRFGIRTATTSLWEWQELARKAEAVGFDTLIAQDHFGKQFAPLPALVAASAVTRRLRLGTVVDNDFRHPATLAKEAATVDVMTSGRLELGLGAGGLQSDYAKTGLPFDPPAERLERLGEAVQICKLFFTAVDETISFAGQHYRVEQLDASPRPTQKPRPPIMIGGRQRRMLSLAAREADIVGISLLDGHVAGQPAPPSFGQKVDWVRAAAGERFDELELYVNAAHVDVTEHPEAAIDEIAARTGESPALVQESPGTLIGSVEAIVDQLLARRAQYGVSYYVVHARFIDAFAPIITRLNGS